MSFLGFSFKNAKPAAGTLSDGQRISMIGEILRSLDKGLQAVKPSEIEKACNKKFRAETGTVIGLMEGLNYGRGIKEFFSGFEQKIAASIYESILNHEDREKISFQSLFQETSDSFLWHSGGILPRLPVIFTQLDKDYAFDEGSLLVDRDSLLKRSGLDNVHMICDAMVQYMIDELEKLDRAGELETDLLDYDLELYRRCQKEWDHKITVPQIFDHDPGNLVAWDIATSIGARVHCYLLAQDLEKGEQAYQERFRTPDVSPTGQQPVLPKIA